MKSPHTERQQISRWRLTAMQWSVLSSSIVLLFAIIIADLSSAEASRPVVPVAEEPLTRESRHSTWAHSRNVGLAGVGAGAALAAVLTGLLWRKRVTLTCNVDARARVSDAADGLPRARDLKNWSLASLRDRVAEFAESDEFSVIKVAEDPRQLLLTRMGRGVPSVMVYCVAGPEGQATVDHVSELLGVLSRSNIATGWLVCPQGLTRKAQKLATSKNEMLVVVDAQAYLHMLRGVSSVAVGQLMSPNFA